MEAVLQALEKVHGDLSNGERRFQAALAKVELDAPNGHIRLDGNRQAIGASYLNRILPGKGSPALDDVQGGPETSTRPSAATSAGRIRCRARRRRRAGTEPRRTGRADQPASGTSEAGEVLRRGQASGAKPFADEQRRVTLSTSAARAAPRPPLRNARGARRPTRRPRGPRPRARRGGFDEKRLRQRHPAPLHGQRRAREQPARVAAPSTAGPARRSGTSQCGQPRHRARSRSSRARSR